jgi:hypothetical protein
VSALRSDRGHTEPQVLLESCAQIGH